MIELGKQEGYSLRLVNSEKDLGTLANVNRNLTPEEINKIIKVNTWKYSLENIRGNVKYFMDYGKFKFNIFDNLRTQISATGYPYALEFSDGKILTLSGPTSVMKYKIIKPIEELFKREGISFSNSAKIKIELKSGNLGKESSAIPQFFSMSEIGNKPVKIDYSYEGTIKNLNNILEKPISGKKNTVTFSLDANKKEKIFDILAGKIFKVSSEKALTETQKTALNNILGKAVSAIDERSVFMSEDLLDIINRFYANVEWLTNDKPVLTVDAYKATDSFFGWFSPNGVSVKGLPYNKEDFYNKFDTIIRTMAQNHKEFNMILRFHGSYNGRIQLTDKLESNIPTLLARIKANSGTSKVNIITTACFGQSTEDFTEQVIKYGFNYIGFSSVNNIMFSGPLFNRIATTITDFPQTFLNAISVGYLGSVLVYEGKVYRALDIAKEFYKDNPAVSAQVKYLHELFFGRNPIDAMMKLSKQKDYTLTLFNSEEDLKLLNGFKPLTFEEIKKQVNRDRARYNVRKFTEAFFTDRLILPNGGIWLPRFFKTLTNDIQIGAHQFLIELKNGKVLGLSGPTAKMKKDVLKSVQETFRNEGIPFSQPTEVIKESKKTTSGSL